MVSLLHSPEALLGPGSSSRNVDLTVLAPDFDDDMDIGKIEKGIFDECEPRIKASRLSRS